MLKTGSDVERNDTGLSGGQMLFSQESLPDLHILSVIFSGNKIFHRTKCPADRKLCRTKPSFDFFSWANVRCLAIFKGLLCLKSTTLL